MLLKRIMNQVVETSPRDLVAPTGKVQKGDRVLGTLSDDLRRLYAVSVLSRKRCEEVLDKHRARVEACKDPDTDLSEKEKESILRDCNVAKNERGLTRQAFWASVYDAFPEGIGESLYLSEKWEVVVQDPRNALRESLNSFIEAFCSASDEK